MMNFFEFAVAVGSLFVHLKSLHYAEAFRTDFSGRTSNFRSYGFVKKAETLSTDLIPSTSGPLLMRSLQGPASSSVIEAGSSSDSELKSSFCQRISSKEAATLIRDAYKSCENMGENESLEGLLIITSDASRGANRLTGLAAISREIVYGPRHSNAVEKLDNLHIATRRIHTQNAKDIFKSEVAALALGIKTILNHIPLSGQRIVFLTDSASAIDFFCGTCTTSNTRDSDIGDNSDSNSIDKNTSWGDKRIPTTRLNDPHFKVMQTLMNECQKQPLMAKVKSNKLQTDGFFDHDATDIISSFVKGVANKDIEQMYINRVNIDVGIGAQAGVGRFDDDRSCSKGNNPTQYPSSARQVFAPPLNDCDIDFLSTSEEKLDKDDQVKKPQIILKRERGARLERTKLRIRKELGVDPVKRKGNV